ncbi:MAG: hypothetical protein KAR45_15070, partial [Desulfobacteraceae bacterium]|nr:hypothetical protein [Desulfobacteraceae bacterium]
MPGKVFLSGPDQREKKMSMKAVQKTITAIDHSLTNVFSFLIVLGGALMTLTVVVQVLLRYVFKQ